MWYLYIGATVRQKGSKAIAVTPGNHSLSSMGIHMNRINWLFTLSSINVLLVTIERFSFTTTVLLPPYNFLRLHEVLQMSTLILFTVLIPLFLLREVTQKWAALQARNGMLWLTVFAIGVYFYATGNGVHELASFQFNTYCQPDQVTGALCGGMFFNDYYFGNGLYFLGAILMNLPFLAFERRYPTLTFAKSHLPILIFNSLIYALAIFAYAAFDRVWVGFVYALLMTLLVDIALVFGKKPYYHRPVTLWLAIAYTVGTLASLPVRFH